MKVIDCFDGKHDFLSNFYPSPIVIKGILYPTVEHAFQAMKTLDEDERLMIAKLDSPAKAKRAGKKVKLRDNWEQIKVAVMKVLVREKFQKHEDIRLLLLETKDSKLVEGNYWHDYFWGVCNDKGQNNLGKILMEVREEFLTR